MPIQRHIARDISYAHSAQTRGGRVLIKLMENATGRVGLIKRARGYEDDVTNGNDFWQVMVQRYGLHLGHCRRQFKKYPAQQTADHHCKPPLWDFRWSDAGPYLGTNAG
jgi:hypothetical protein